MKTSISTSANTGAECIRFSAILVQTIEHTYTGHGTWPVTRLYDKSAQNGRHLGTEEC